MAKILALLVILVSIVTFVIALYGGAKMVLVWQHTPLGWLRLTNTLLFFAIAFLLYHIASTTKSE